MTRPTRSSGGFPGSRPAAAGKGRGAAPSASSKGRPPREKAGSKAGPGQDRSARPARAAAGSGRAERNERPSHAPKGAHRATAEDRNGKGGAASRQRPGSSAPRSDSRSRPAARGDAPAPQRSARPGVTQGFGRAERKERPGHAAKGPHRAASDDRNGKDGAIPRSRPGSSAPRSDSRSGRGDAPAPARSARPGPIQGFGRAERKERPIRVPKSVRSGPVTERRDDGAGDAEKSEAAQAIASDVRKVTVSANEAGQRIDNFLLKRLPGVPKSHVYRLLRSGQVRVGGGRAKPERKLEEGEEVRIPPVRIAERGAPVRAPDAVLNRLREAIVYEDPHYLAISKPAGLASHGGTGIAYGVIEAARGWDKYEFLELAHRLDRDTSGVLLLAKSRPALLRAQRAFRDGLANKRYFALLVGRLQGGAREVDAALVKSRLEGGERYVEIDDEDGKPSRSRFVPQAHYRDATLCEVEIFSGRTHQIRVHALALGHPVAGDRKYGLRDEQKALRDLGLRRMFLHSHFLELPVEGEFRKLTLSAPMTGELRDFLGALGPGK